MTEYGVVVVTHDSEAVIGRCLDALERAAGPSSVVVVDNASRDGTLAAVRARGWVRLIANPCNRGFAAAVNQGIDVLKRECVLLLNPDTELAGARALADACAQPDVAAAGGKLIGRDGRPQSGFNVRRLPTPSTLAFEVLGINRLWPGNAVNGRYRCVSLDPEARAEVEQPAGAFLMIRRGVWRELGGFDERFYPLWFEDVDFLKRAKGKGYRVVYEPQAVAWHEGGHSVRQLPASSRPLYWYGTLLAYAAKHFRPAAVRGVCAAVMLGSMFRAVTALVRRGSLTRAAVYMRVLRLASRAFRAGQGEGLNLFSAFARQ